ncbi:MAG: hypothetical protein GY941_09970 [Planctomycetes bacterium]|nr:hypothetical protein [Planctomycetota bacterium]
MKAYFRKRQEELYSAFETSAALGHSVPKGNERELIASQFLAQHMPPAVDATQGVLIDQNTVDFTSLSQTTSPQLDLLLVMSHLPQLTLYGGTKLFFAESVVAVLEVKTKLSLSEIDKILTHCRKVKQYKRQRFGLYWAEPDDKTTEPSENVPYYVVAFDTSKNALDIMTILKERSKDEGLSEEDQKALYPDGIFVLNPDAGTLVLKDIGLHKLRSDLKVGPFYGTEIKTDCLCALWFTLMAQAESVRFLNFPNQTYINKLFPKP